MEENKLADAIIRLAKVLKTLRAPGGCPWDAAQTPDTLKPYLLEETYEVLEAIDSGSVPAIREELGDLLLQVVFHATIFAERGDFDFADVASGITDKLIRRHPHVFGSAGAMDSDQLDRQWENIKAVENRTKSATTSPFSNIPKELPALQRAYKIIEKADRAGLHLVLGEEDELRKQAVKEINLLDVASVDNFEITNRFGEVLLSMVRLAYRLGVPPEEALRKATSSMEQQLVSLCLSGLAADAVMRESESP